MARVGALGAGPRLDSALSTRSASHSLGGRRALAALALCLAACSSPERELERWRADLPPSRPVAERPSVDEELATLRARRGRGDLAGARDVALQLAVERPADPDVLHLASRAESDTLLLLRGQGREQRDRAAWSALDYARRAAAGAGDPAIRAQLAWALGSATHLQPMFSRAGHAARTLEEIEAVLAQEPEQVRALATRAVLELRLSTLPWIADLFAFGAPEASLEGAEATARRCVELRPSRETRLILAKVLLARGEEGAARDVLTAARAAPARYPRDRALEPEITELLDGLGVVP